MKNLCSLNSDTTIKEFLTKELLFSSSVVKKEVPKKNQQLKAGPRSELEIPLNLLNNQIINPIYTGPEINIIDEDDDFIVVNKPAFIHGHPLRYEENKTVLNFLRSRFNLPWLGHRDENQERGLLYRLDEQTSGVLVYVKDQELHQQLRNNFSSIMTKEYIAIVEGNLDIDEELTHYLGGSGSKGARVVEKDGGRECQAHFKSLKKVNGNTLVKVNLKTGFRHQIRVQCSLLGHPIVGDELYGAQAEKRIYLHAYSYEINDNEIRKKWVSNEDQLFNDFLNLNCRFDVL
jgi:23S rRNA pseudouridine1911/1915/1917 synthase